MLTKKISALFVFLLLPSALIYAERAFYGSPPDAHHPWAVHDRNRPQPPIVTPADTIGQPPSDAIVLFDGTEASFHENWIHEKSEDARRDDWVFVDGRLESRTGAGNLITRESFGDCQLRIEWRAPQKVSGKGQRRGNSGVFLMNMVEIQILDNYNNPTYPDGTVGAVYGVMPPAANALRPPEEWQTYDIIFRRPIVRNGEVIETGSLTVFLNGVVIQDSTPLEGGGAWRRRTPFNRPFPEVGPLGLQDHQNPVSFRNIWYRPLRPRPADGGTDGRLSEEATREKRAEIASELRQDAQSLEGLEKAYRLFESLTYAEQAEARATANQIIADYIESLRKLPSEDIQKERNRVLRLGNVLRYLTENNFIADDHFAIAPIDTLAIQSGWRKDYSK